MTRKSCVHCFPGSVAKWNTHAGPFLSRARTDVWKRARTYTDTSSVVVVAFRKFVSFDFLWNICLLEMLANVICWGPRRDSWSLEPWLRRHCGHQALSTWTEVLCLVQEITGAHRPHSTCWGRAAICVLSMRSCTACPGSSARRWHSWDSDFCLSVCTVYALAQPFWW